MATGRVRTERSKWGIEEQQVCWRSFWGKYGHRGSTEKLNTSQSLEGLSLFSGKGQLATLGTNPFGKDCAILELVGMKHPC